METNHKSIISCIALSDIMHMHSHTADWTLRAKCYKRIHMADVMIGNRIPFNMCILKFLTLFTIRFSGLNIGYAALVSKANVFLLPLLPVLSYFFSPFYWIITMFALQCCFFVVVAHVFGVYTAFIYACSPNIDANIYKSQ